MIKSTSWKLEKKGTAAPQNYFQPFIHLLGSWGNLFDCASRKQGALSTFRLVSRELGGKKIGSCVSYFQDRYIAPMNFVTDPVLLPEEEWRAKGVAFLEILRRKVPLGHKKDERA